MLPGYHTPLVTAWTSTPSLRVGHDARQKGSRQPLHQPCKTSEGKTKCCSNVQLNFAIFDLFRLSKCLQVRDQATRYHKYNCDYATVRNATALMWSYYWRHSVDTCVKPLSIAQCELCVSTRLSRPRQSWLLLQLIKSAALSLLTIPTPECFLRMTVSTFWLLSGLWEMSLFSI